MINNLQQKKRIILNKQYNFIAIETSNENTLNVFADVVNLNGADFSVFFVSKIVMNSLMATLPPLSIKIEDISQELDVETSIDIITDLIATKCNINIENQIETKFNLDETDSFKTSLNIINDLSVTILATKPAIPIITNMLNRLLLNITMGIDVSSPFSSSMIDYLNIDSTINVLAPLSLYLNDIVGNVELEINLDEGEPYPIKDTTTIQSVIYTLMNIDEPLETSTTINISSSSTIVRLYNDSVYEFSTSNLIRGEVLVKEIELHTDITRLLIGMQGILNMSCTIDFLDRDIEVQSTFNNFLNMITKLATSNPSDDVVVRIPINYNATVNIGVYYMEQLVLKFDLQLPIKTRLGLLYTITTKVELEGEIELLLDLNTLPSLNTQSYVFNELIINSNVSIGRFLELEYYDNDTLNTMDSKTLQNILFG